MTAGHDNALLELAARMREVAELIKQPDGPEGDFPRSVRTDMTPRKYDARLHKLSGELLQLARKIESP